MAKGNWGHCQTCKYFDSPSQMPDGAEEARCLQPDLRTFDLMLTAGSGCNAHEMRAGMEIIEEERAPRPQP